MKLKPTALYIIVILFAFGCSDSSLDETSVAIENPTTNTTDTLEIVNQDSIDRFNEEKYKGFLKINAFGKWVHLGSNEAMANIMERPQMKVVLVYDYYMQRSEVTCGEYASLMGGKCKEGEAELPVTNVSFWNAILYANEKSKIQGLDTVYSYSSVIKDLEGDVAFLEDYAFNEKVEGYRLPSEAEWVYAASLNFDIKKSVNSTNSNYKKHKPCSMEEDDSLLCDMLGNVTEWVNDWKAYFRDTTLSNYVGAFDGGDLAERVVKGGNYAYNPDMFSLHSRGDIYKVASATKADYVGFRLCIGKMPFATYTSVKGDVVDSRIWSNINLFTFRKIFGTYNGKMVFRDDVTGRIGYVDYQYNAAEVFFINDTLDSYHPTISPDGKYVAFSTKLEGLSGKSRLFVRELNTEGTGLVELNVESAAIPRWRVNPLGEVLIDYVTDAGVNTNEDVWKTYSTWTVPFSNGQFGTPRKLFDGSYNGGVYWDESMAISGSRLLRVREGETPATEKVWYNGEQACNASLSLNGYTLFLDFGGKMGREFAQSNYASHERLLVMDPNGNLISAVPSPLNYTFDHAEWINDSMAVATLVNAKGARTSIVVVNVRDSSITKLVSGDELWHPFVWTNNLYTYEDNSADDVLGLDRDSAGVYCNEYMNPSYWILRSKIDLMWKYHDSVEIAIFGSSRAMDGVYPPMMTSGFALNIAHAPSNIHITRRFVETYFLKYMPKLKAIVISLDLDMWYKLPNEDWSIIAQVPGYVYDENHHFSNEQIDSIYSWSIQGFAYDEPLETMIDSTKGLLLFDAEGWGESAFLYIDSTLCERDSFAWNESFNSLEEILKATKDKDVKVVGIVFPQSPLYREIGAFGKYGLKRSTAEKLIEKIADLKKTYPHFTLMDENKMGYHDYTDEEAYDHDHLCTTGAYKLTGRLDSLLMDIFDGRSNR
ncbi:MAG: TIGR02171 family protein [Fibrobacteraceae bacterium]|nr:TIGR02171 family protein [Fibrobacteraceae bacterium]